MNAKHSKPACSRCSSSSCRGEGSPACRERARKAALAAYEAKKAAEKAAAPQAESWDDMMRRAATESKAKAEAERAAFYADPAKGAAARLFEAQSAQSMAEQAASYRAADYREVETPADAYRAEREADRRHEDH